MLVRFYPQLIRNDIDRFLNQIEQLSNNYSKTLTAAQLQGFFMHHRDSIKHVFDNIHQLYSV